MNSSASAPIPTPSTAAPRVRLHISPFTPDLYARVIPASAQAEATNISYHTIQTFPERGFGYVELSKMEADKVKKKLNGMTLKGSKVRVEEARPEKKMKRKAEREEDGEGEEERMARKKARKERKAKKREEGVIPGHELEEGRHVKRGWTDEKSKRKDREGKKMKFKTSVPPNALPVEEPEKKKAKSKEKKEKKGRAQKVVQEFSKTKKPTSLTNVVENATPASYEEGRGWVNEDGEVVEAEHAGKKRRREAEKARKAAEEAEAQARALQESAKKPADSVVDGADQSESEEVSSVSSDSSSESSASEDEDDDVDETLPDAPPAALSTPAKAAPETATASRSPSPTSPADPAREIHPLEALYKRRPNIAPIKTFGFFNSDDTASVTSDSAPGAQGQSQGQTVTIPPQTPHTKQDLEWRGMRSAAPTPDTAAIGKRFSFALPEDVDEEDEDVDEEYEDDVAKIFGRPGDTFVGTSAATTTDKKEESAFRKWFYERRGDHNRGWKKKRREGKKVQRQRENRRVSRRVV